MTKEEAEKAASDVGNWKEISVTKDAVTATRIADILDKYEMSIEARHIQSTYVISTCILCIFNINVFFVSPRFDDFVLFAW